MRVAVLVSVPVARCVLVVVVVMVAVIRFEMNVELHAGDGGLLLARDVEVIAFELELLKLLLKPARVHAQVQQRGNEHIAGDATNEVEIEDFHRVH
jgi:hypothetical protein